METIPAMSIMNGSVVKVEDGRYIALKNEKGRARNPGNVLKELKESYETTYILDIDGIERNAPDLNWIQKTASILPLWYDACPITPTGVMDLLVAGASKVVVGTRRLRSLSQLKEILEMSENIIFSIDFDDGLISPSQELVRMEINDLASATADIGVKSALFFDFGRLRTHGQLARFPISKMIEVFDNVYVAGVLNPGEITELESLGASGAIVDFKDLRKWNNE